MLIFFVFFFTILQFVFNRLLQKKTIMSVTRIYVDYTITPRRSSLCKRWHQPRYLSRRLWMKLYWLEVSVDGGAIAGLHFNIRCLMIVVFLLCRLFWWQTANPTPGETRRHLCRNWSTLRLWLLLMGRIDMIYKECWKTCGEKICNLACWSSPQKQEVNAFWERNWNRSILNFEFTD